MSKHREQSLKNRMDILKRCYPLLATGSWDAITVADLEKAITQTKGAIIYYFKNKKTLFANVFDELFFPVFTLSQEEREALAKSSVSDFYKLYKTPFERVRDDLRDIWCRKSVTGNLQSFYPRLQTLRQIHIKYQRIDAVGTEHSLILISYSTILTLFTRANG